jgi:hypothetical protein
MSYICTSPEDVIRTIKDDNEMTRSAVYRPSRPERHGRPSRRGTGRDDKLQRDRLEKALEIGLEDTFPASDAVAAVQPAPTLPSSAREN